MANQYVNKVQKSDGTTIIDITDTTATAADVATGKYFYAVSGEKTEGLNAGGNAFLISDTTDMAGGTIRTATAIEVAGTKSITDNGTYDVTSFASADVSVPASAVDTGTKSITTNGTHDVIGYASANVAVPASAVDTGTKSISISSNSTTTHDVVGYASASITASVPNSYSASDEGKVVSSGALVAQTAHADVTPTTSDQTIDTTTNNSIKVKGDADLVAGNIKKDVEIFGVTGSYEGSGGGYDLLDIVTRAEPTGDVVLDSTSNFNVRTYFFQNYTGITSFSSNKALQLHGYAFQNCSNMTSVNCPNCSKLEGSVFEGCSKLASITLSNYYSLSGGNQFRTCTSLVNFDFWGSGTATTMFYGCSNLEFVDCKNLDLYNFAANTFQNCTKLKTLIIRKTSGVAALAATSAFNGTPGASGGSGLTVYVPNSLVSTYQTATNWQTLYNGGTITFQKIEGSIYE